MTSKLEFTIPLNPVTKKNSSRIIVCGKRRMILPSEKFIQYQKDVAWFLRGKIAPEGKLNIKALYYRSTLHTVDLSNLNSALHDVLVYYKIIKDDSYKFIGGADGSRVYFDAKNPRTEVTITILED